MTKISFLSGSRPLAAALLLGLAACTGGPKPQTPSAVAVVSPIERAVQLLDLGDEKGARKLLQPLLRRDPGNVAAKLLMTSIEQDPVALLGPASFPYRTEPGDTMLGLSTRFLGNRLKFYELSRYNGLSVPAHLAAGTLVKIPGEAPRPVAPPEPPVTPPPPHAAAPRPAPKKPRSGAGATASAPAPTPAEAPRAAVTDPAMAQRLRGAALSQLSQGHADRAAALLRRAQALAPGNPLIARDLARAERIAQTVRAQR